MVFLSTPSLRNCTALTPAQIADLLNFVLNFTFFQYNGSVFEQLEGAAMGSPVSAVIANIYMDSFEQQATTTSSYNLRIYGWWCAMQTENDCKIAFFGTAVSRKPNARLTTGVYRKPTYSAQRIRIPSTRNQ